MARTGSPLVTWTEEMLSPSQFSLCYPIDAIAFHRGPKILFVGFREDPRSKNNEIEGDLMFLGISLWFLAVAGG